MGRGAGGFRGGRGGGGGMVGGGGPPPPGRGGFSPGGPGRGMGRGAGGGGGGGGGGGQFDGGFEDQTTFAVPADKCGLVIGKGGLLFSWIKVQKGCLLCMTYFALLQASLR